MLKSLQYLKIVVYNLLFWIKGIFGFIYCGNTHELKNGCNFAGEAHSLKVEKILFQGKSEYQNVMVFQVHEVTISPISCSYFLSLFLMHCCDFFCSHQHMARFLFWMESFSSQKGMNVPTKK